MHLIKYLYNKSIQLQQKMKLVKWKDKKNTSQNE